MMRIFGLSTPSTSPTSEHQPDPLAGQSSEKEEQEQQQPQELRALPACWYRSAAMFELERRAIFSQKWLLVTHALRFQSAGDYAAFAVAGFSFFLVRDRDGRVNGFHNACRHRAYPIVTDDAGHTHGVLACGYHGWCYGLKGNLAKAPRFESVKGFDKTQHALHPVHVHVDALGFVWVNLEAGGGEDAPPRFRWQDDFCGVDEQPRWRQFDLRGDYAFDHAWTLDGAYNWKTLADNYNECYHCPTGHPGVAAVADLSKYYVETQGGQIVHFSTNKDETDDGVRVASTFLFPNASITVTPHFFYLMRCIPLTPSSSRMEYEVYRHKSASDEEFKRINSFFKQVLQEDKELCNAAQRNLNAGIFINGQLHPEKEKGPLYFQKTVRKLVMDHRSREESEAGGAEIWPARPRPAGPMRTAKLAEEERFCAALERSGCAMDGQDALAW